MGRNVWAEESRAEIVLGRGVPEPVAKRLVIVNTIIEQLVKWGLNGGLFRFRFSTLIVYFCGIN